MKHFQHINNKISPIIRRGPTIYWKKRGGKRKTSNTNIISELGNIAIRIMFKRTRNYFVYVETCVTSHQTVNINHFEDNLFKQFSYKSKIQALVRYKIIYAYFPKWISRNIVHLLSSFFPRKTRAAIKRIRIFLFRADGITEA